MENHPIHKHPVKLETYNPNWPQLFEEEAQRLRLVFGDNLVTIHHIGSTSIPNMTAKPIIDMIPVVHDLKRVDEVNTEMEHQGYIPMGELGIPGRRFFCKSIELRTHNVHVYEEGDSNIPRHLKFRDILRENAELAMEYQRLKERLAQDHREDRKAYTDAKTDFIRKVESQEY